MKNLKKPRLALATVAFLTSCDQAPQNPPPTGAAVTNPVGRYQMQEGINPASVAVLDTRYGTLQNCFIVDNRYHCLSQDRSAENEGGLPDPPSNAN